MIVNWLTNNSSIKLPNLYKFITSFQILFITNPEGWTAAAVYQATRIFSSNLNEKMTQR